MTRRAIGLITLVVTGALALVVPVPPAAAAVPAPPTVECPAPPAGNAAVVQLAYVVLLRRCPEPSGLEGWTRSLDGGMTAEQFARRIASTVEARGVIVDDAYQQILGRAPSSADRVWWAQWLQPRPDARNRHDRLLAQLAASAELWNAAGATAGGFVDRIYARVLGRPADADGRAYWVGLLEAGGSRQALVRTLARLREPLGVTVIAAYREILDRAPTPLERDSEVAGLGADGDRAGLSARILGRGELYLRAQTFAVTAPGTYVALGDSYVSGEGNRPYWPGEEVGSTDGCHRSAGSYAEVARTLGGPVPGTLDLQACSGAVLHSIYGGSQLDAVDGDTDLVTVTIGGNDIGFVPILTACLQVMIGSAQVSPFYSDEECDLLLDEWAPQVLAGLETGEDGGDDCAGGPCTLAGVVADVAAAAPDARIAVVGYPPLLPPANGDCTGVLRWEDGTPALGGRWLFAAQYVPRARALIAGLNAALRRAAEGAGATFVDPAPAFAGHTVCDADPYIYGLRLLDDEGIGIDTASFHPTRAGGRAVAASLVAALDD